MFYGYEDEKLDYRVEDIKRAMQDALYQIDICEAEGTDWNTTDLKRDINRFLEDW